MPENTVREEQTRPNGYDDFVSCVFFVLAFVVFSAQRNKQTLLFYFTCKYKLKDLILICNFFKINQICRYKFISTYFEKIEPDEPFHFLSI
jgi:hypothetical protein